MPVVPAVCDHCSTVFSSGIRVEGTLSATMVGNRSGPCPRCGAMGTIPDGLYKTFGTTIRVLATRARSAESLARLAQILGAARTKALSGEALADEIDKEAPEFSGLAHPLRQMALWDLNKWIVTLAAIIAMLLAAYGTLRSSDGLSTEQVDRLWEQFVQALPTLARSAPVASPEPTAGTVPALESRPNDPCPCGSGNRYKHCHGARAFHVR